MNVVYIDILSYSVSHRGLGVRQLLRELRLHRKVLRRIGRVDDDGLGLLLGLFGPLHGHGVRCIRLHVVLNVDLFFHVNILPVAEI